MNIKLTDGREINLIEEYNKLQADYKAVKDKLEYLEVSVEWYVKQNKVLQDKIDMISNKLKADVKDGCFLRHGIKQGGKGGDTYYKITAKEYAQECLEDIE